MRELDQAGLPRTALFVEFAFRYMASPYGMRCYLIGMVASRSSATTRPKSAPPSAGEHP